MRKNIAGPERERTMKQAIIWILGLAATTATAATYDCKSDDGLHSVRVRYSEDSDREGDIEVVLKDKDYRKKFNGPAVKAYREDSFFNPGFSPTSGGVYRVDMNERFFEAAILYQGPAPSPIERFEEIPCQVEE
jgi:hypothetical protein